MRLLIVLVTLGGVPFGCGVPRGGLSDTGRSDVGMPDAGTDAMTDAPVDVPPLDSGMDAPDAGCTEGESRCAASTLETCDASGDFVMSEDCALGCEPTAPAHCLELVPSNVGSVEYVDDAVTLDDETWDTDVCESLPGEASVVMQGAGEIEICLVRVGDLRVDGTLTVTGSRGLAVVAKRTINILNIRADATGRVGGPGGGAGGDQAGTPAEGAHAGTPGSPFSSFGDGGGGGGGFCNRGGTGGDIAGTPAGGVGGSGAAPSYRLVPLAGGSGGGRGGRASDSSGAGGGGGGALQLSSQGVLRIEGTINISGGGGAAGVDSAVSNTGAGGGGGSGGGLLLESATAIVFGGAAAVVAGGGGGGAGASCLDTCRGGVASSAGCEGDQTPICGGTTGGDCMACGLSGGFGANGGVGGTTAAAFDGDANGSTVANSGGGGGGPGCIVLKSDMADSIPISVGVVRPDSPTLQ